jgi:SAM-dependent methyltransferase
VGSERSEIEDREREFFERHYEGQAANPAGLRERMRRELRALLRMRGPAGLGRVLSIGCGNGLFELALAPHADAVVGIDISPVAIEQARAAADAQGIANAEFRCLPLSQLRWDERFDAIVCLAFLHHVAEAELDSFLRQVHAHVRPGGFFYSQDPNVRGVLRKLGRLVLGDGYDRHHSSDERELDPADTGTRLLAAGFDAVEIGYIDLTLIPLQYVLPTGHERLMRSLVRVDRIWCASPFARWASGFNAFATRAR